MRDTPVAEQLPGPEIEGTPAPEFLIVKISSGLQLSQDGLDFRRGAVAGQFACQFSFGVIPEAQ